MSAVAHAPRAPALERRHAVRVPPAALRLAAFAALAGFCLAHYALLVRPAPGGRVVALVLVCAAGGAALAASARLPRAAGLAARVAALLALAVASLAATGLAPRLLLPAHWRALGDGLDGGFAALSRFEWPYAAGDHWVRLTILLAMPALAVPATALAFWPARRARALLRAAAIVPLVVAYGTGVTDLGLGAWAARGAALLLLIAAYLWLPSLGGRDALVALGAVAACGLAALPLGAGLDAHRPWVDYRSWQWFSQVTAGTTFAWDHGYGPIAWPRTGTLLMAVRSPQPHYWKAESLDRFDGLRWIHSDAPFGDAREDIPQPMPPRWDEHLTVTVHRLATRVVVGAGTVYQVDTDHSTATEPDGTVRVLDGSLGDGDSYRVSAYVPDPSAARMRAAPSAYPQRLVDYTYFDLPSRRQSGFARPDLTDAARSRIATSQTIGNLLAGAPLGAAAVRRVLASPYGRVYRLARSLAAGRPTTYDVVQSVDRYLQRGFTYSERPPQRRYPLPAFLFRDRTGYCQQFSGAMALMLRMNGIPARVAAGFSPGAYDHATHQYEIRDYDAHSWVEVWFTGIGWVPFDPTPSAAPASSQSSSSSAISAARGGHDTGSPKVGAARRAVLAGPDAPVAQDGSHLWILIVGLGALAAAALAALWLAGVLRRRPHFAASPDGAVEELRAALARLGYRYPARTTLAELERRLRVTNGDAAASYVELLRGLRYAPPGRGRVPGQSDRRELRRALTAGGGPLARLRGLLALPPHPGRGALRRGLAGHR